MAQVIGSQIGGFFRGILGLPGKGTIIFALVLPFIVIFVAGVINRMFPEIGGFMIILNSFTELFLLFISLTAIFIFVGSEVVINLFIGPISALFFNNLISPFLNFINMILQFILFSVSGVVRMAVGMPFGDFISPVQSEFVFNPVDFSNFIYLFSGFFISIADIPTNNLSDGQNGSILLGLLTGSKKGISSNNN